MKSRFHRLAAGLAVLFAASATAQQEAPLQYVAGRPMVKATLRAGDKTYIGNLLIDLSRLDGLFLHANAAQSLGALSCDVHAGGITWKDLSFRAGKDGWLEQFTKNNANELKEVPLVGMIGLAALREFTVELDGPGKTLRLLPLSQGNEKPQTERSSPLTVLDLTAEIETGGLQVAVRLEDGKSVPFALHSKEGASLIRASLADKLGHPDGSLERATAKTFDLLARTPLRPDSPPMSAAGTIGGNLLAQSVLTISFGGGWISLEPKGEPVFPKDEAAYYQARFGPEPSVDLQDFIDDFPESSFRHTAARQLLQSTISSGATDPLQLVDSCLVSIEAASEDGRATEALTLLANLPRSEAWREVRKEIAEKGLEFAEADLDGQAPHKLRLELGDIAREDGDHKQARRHLLSAAFGMPGDGPTSLALGKLYEDQGQLERAASRYLLAMLDMKKTGVQGYAALERVYGELGETRSMAEILAEEADGRVPAFHPIPREPEDVKPNGRIVLGELYTGAMCPPCAAADVAFDALGEYYGNDEVALIVWHLPVPAPEPMVAPVSFSRAKARGIRSTPNAVFGGIEVIKGGGPADKGAATFEKYRAAVDKLLASTPEAEIHASATLDADDIVLKAHVTSERSDLRLHAILVENTLIFPGSNGILFHHYVARERMTAERGVAMGDAALSTPFTCTTSSSEVEFSLDRAVAQYEEKQEFEVRPTELDTDNLSVVLFVEDPITHAAVQAIVVPVTTEKESKQK